MDLLWLALLVSGLLAGYLSTYQIHGYPFPVGPDAPVYLWWARLASHDGLSAVVGRPGVPALTLVLSGSLGIGTAAAVAALEIVLAVCVGMAAVALTVEKEARGSARATWVLAGALSGLFAVHLAVGYVATLTVAALFLAAAAALAHGTRRGALAAAMLLAAAGFAHAEFLAVGVAVLVVSALPSLINERGRGSLLDSEHGRIALALIGGLGLTALGTVAMLSGPPALNVDTSRDDFLKRSGFVSLLRQLFRDRLIEHAPLYVPYISVPLCLLGVRGSSGFLGRFLRSWALVLLLSVPFAFVTGLFPADRLVTFAFVLPIGAALGLVWLWRAITKGRLRPPRVALASLLGAGLVGVMATVWVHVWLSTPPEIFPTEVHRATEAGRYASATPPGTPLVFSVSGRQPIASFFATQAANALRASVPPGRIRDVRVVVPPGFDPIALNTKEGRQLVRSYWRGAFDNQAPGTGALWFDLAPFDRTNFGRPFGATSASDPHKLVPRIVGHGVGIIGPHPAPASRPIDPLEPSSPHAIAEATLAVLGLVTAAGYGWTRASVGSGVRAIALAPAIGVAGLILAGIVIDRAGISLSERAGPTAATITFGAAGYMTWLVVRLRARSSLTARSTGDTS